MKNKLKNFKKKAINKAQMQKLSGGMNKQELVAADPWN